MTKSRQQIEEEIIPGIGLLTKEKRLAFNSGEEALWFNNLVANLLNSQQSVYLIDLNFSRLRRATAQQQILTFFARIKDSAWYASLKNTIIQAQILSFYPFLEQLPADLKSQLASQPYSQAIFSKPMTVETKQAWFNEFICDETPGILDLVEQFRLSIIHQELLTCYPHYLFLNQSDQQLLVNKPYSMAFCSYPTVVAQDIWHNAWINDDSQDALQIKNNERLASLYYNLEHIYPFFKLLDEHDRATLAQTPYSNTLLTSPSPQAWLNAFEQDESENVAAIKEKHTLRRIKDTIRAYYPAYIYLSPNARDTLARTWYSAKLTSNTPLSQEDWLRALANDSSDNIQAIKEQAHQEYQYHLGFLFRHPTPNWQAIIEHMYAPNIATEQKIADLIHRLNQDWVYQKPIWATISYNIKNSLNYLLQYPIQGAQTYVNDIANAHAFYRFFGMSSDNIVCGLQFELGERTNGLPIVNLLDLYNYHKNRKSIKEALNIWQALRIPLNLFLDEYLEIGRFEKNPLKICLRAFIPFVVMAFFLTLGYSLVLPLATHVFLEYLLFMPSLYLSIAGASLYLHIRNEAYTNLMAWYYNGYFNCPLFQANERLKLALNEPSNTQKNHSTATLVAKYYTQKFEECEQIEAHFSKRKSFMNSTEIAQLVQCSKLKFELYLEWYDIHERVDVPIDQIPQIILNRLKKDRSDLLQQVRASNEEYVTKYSQHNLTFFRHSKNSQLRDDCALRNRKLIELESLACKITSVITGWEQQLSEHNSNSLCCV